MVSIFALRIPQKIDLFNYERLLLLVEPVKRSRILAYHNISDSLRCLFGDLLIRKIIIEKFNIQNNRIIFNYDEYGKPHINDINDFHFNISHSGEWVVCAVSNQVIGVDVEEIKEIDLSVTNQIFNSYEMLQFKNRSTPNKLNFFYEIWTLKESYIKALGKGLTIPLKSFGFQLNKSKILNQYGTASEYYFDLYDFIPNYKMAVCSSIKPNIKVSFVSYWSIINNFPCI